MLIFNAMTVTVFKNIWSQATKNFILMLKKHQVERFTINQVNWEHE